MVFERAGETYDANNSSVLTIQRTLDNIKENLEITNANMKDRETVQGIPLLGLARDSSLGPSGKLIHFVSRAREWGLYV